jgi:hypothetical protein
VLAGEIRGRHSRRLEQARDTGRSSANRRIAGIEPNVSRSLAYRLIRE